MVPDGWVQREVKSITGRARVDDNWVGFVTHRAFWVHSLLVFSFVLQVSKFLLILAEYKLF
jgi:hypothetical protein